jgi:hypothetical protein
MEKTLYEKLLSEPTDKEIQEQKTKASILEKEEILMGIISKTLENFGFTKAEINPRLELVSGQYQIHKAIRDRLSPETNFSFVVGENYYIVHCFVDSWKVKNWTHRCWLKEIGAAPLIAEAETKFGVWFKSPEQCVKRVMEIVKSGELGNIHYS